MDMLIAAAAGTLAAHMLTDNTHIKPVLNAVVQQALDVKTKALDWMGTEKTSVVTPRKPSMRIKTANLAKALGHKGPIQASKPPRTKGGNAAGRKRAAGQRSKAGKKAPKTRTVKSAPGAASSRQKEEEEEHEHDSEEDKEEEEERDDEPSAKGDLRKPCSVFMYMVPKPGEGVSKAVTGPGKVMMMLIKEGTELRLLGIDDLTSITSIVWSKHATKNHIAWVHFLEVPPAHDVKTDKQGTKLCHVCVYDLLTAADNQKSKGLTVPRDMVEIIKLCANEIMRRAGDLNTFPPSVMAAGGPSLRDENYEYGDA